MGIFVVSKTYCHFWLGILAGDMAYCHKRAFALGLENKKEHVQMYLDSEVEGSTDVDHCYDEPDPKRKRLFSCLFPLSTQVSLWFHHLTVKSV